jgi:uncharacterized protein (DUF3820 family)
MEYLVFPFGKYRGVELTELPSTYIVLALEKFELPEELQIELTRILLGRLGVYSSVLYDLNHMTKLSYRNWLIERRERYEKTY